jgi:hypothetical protein
MVQKSIEKVDIHKFNHGEKSGGEWVGARFALGNK